MYEKHSFPAHRSVTQWRADTWLTYLYIRETLKAKHPYVFKNYKNAIRKIFLKYTSNRQPIAGSVLTNREFYNFLLTLSESGNFPTVTDKNYGILLSLSNQEHNELFFGQLKSSLFRKLEITELKAKNVMRDLFDRAKSLLNYCSIQHIDKSTYNKALDLLVYFIEKCNTKGDTPLASYRPIVKVHKTPIKMRPVIANTQSPLKVLGTVVAGICNKWLNLVYKLTGISCPVLLDSFDLVKRLEALKKYFPDFARTCYIYTVDLESYYTNIPYDILVEQLGQVKNWLVNRFHDPTGVFEQELYFLRKSLAILQDSGLMLVNGEIYIQAQGILQGNSESPGLAQLFLLRRELDWLSDTVSVTQPKPLAITKMSRFYYRFMDDILVLNSSVLTEAQLRYELGVQFLGLKQFFTINIKPERFLDLVILPGLRFHMAMHSPVSNHQYIPYQTNIVPFMVKNAVNAQILRAVTHCSTYEHFADIREYIFRKFICVGFDRRRMQLDRRQPQYRYRDIYLKKIWDKKEATISETKVADPIRKTQTKVKFNILQEQENFVRNIRSRCSPQWVCMNYNTLFDNISTLRYLEKNILTNCEPPIKLSFYTGANITQCIRQHFDRALSISTNQLPKSYFKKRKPENWTDRKSVV